MLFRSENPGSPNYENLKSELKEFKKSTNKFRSLLITGELDIDQVDVFHKEMEFVKLIQHFTQIILMAYGVPAHRVNLTMDVKQVGGQVNRAYEGYYKSINFKQRIIENVFNKELWSHFKEIGRASCRERV